ncbi:MAG: endonuclease [Alphaproteobacteria bacterium]|nr:endonuclease [Alphaproteobacteria bacterium]
MPPRNSKGQYETIISEIFKRHYRGGGQEFTFEREEIAEVGTACGVGVPRNLGDVVYTYRHRSALPDEILKTQPDGMYWLILGAGDAVYRFRLSRLAHIMPTQGLLVRKIPDATPEIIRTYALSDEQALLAKIRYNRLIDLFLGITAYSLQNHLRTKIENYGQIEIDELYVGVNTSGAQSVIPVQAKGGRDKLGVIQTIQDVVYCRTKDKYKDCLARPVSAQFMADDVIAMFELNFDGDDVSIVQERHYRLTDAGQIGPADLELYARGEETP